MATDLNMDEYEKEIYQFIKKNKDCNENDVRNSGICSQKWARIKLMNLVKKEYVEDRRIGKSFHKFRVSDRTRYVSIDRELDNIETQMRIFERPLLNLAEMQDRHAAIVVAAFNQKFVYPYLDSMFTRLFRLLQLSDIDIGKEDSLVLHSRIIPLIANVTREPFYKVNYKKIMAQDMNLLNKFIDELSKPETFRAGFTIHDLKNLVKNIEQFEEKFG